MKSFALKIVFYFTTLVFFSFMLVYFLFNNLVENHITTEASRELEIAMEDALQNLNINFLFNFNRRILFSSSILNTNTIVIQNHVNIISPNPQDLTYEEINLILFLGAFYVENSHYFSEFNMSRTYFEESAYYLKATTYYIYGTLTSILVYTNIDGVILFKNEVNRILIFLLAISAITSITMSIFFGARFRKSIKKLEKYAQTIGHGNFEERLESFKDLEFEHLNLSMQNMSSMLKTYEEGQKKFFSNVSHELRTPLMVIGGYAEGILENVFPKEDAKIILDETKNMEEMVKSLIYISRLDSGLEPLNITEVNMNHFIYSCVENVKVLSNKKIIFDCPYVTFNTDEKKLRKVLINILTNAIRYCEEKVTILCFTENNVLKIKISDDGKGIKEEDLPNIFKRFYKGDDGQTGLGLAIASDMVKSLNGTINASNTENGAEFIISLGIF